MAKIYNLKPTHHELIWGTEDWIVSAHENGDNIIIENGELLSVYVKNHYSEFGLQKGEKFPLLIKIINAKKDLSVQVHPDDEYAQKKENSLGKTESWFILDNEQNTDIIIGQKTNNREELKAAIDRGEIENSLNYYPIEKGDFFFIPAGTVHAIKGGTKILEIQQSSDITYRLYDYNRPGIDGKPRELHIEKSLDVINYEAPKHDYIKSNNKDNILLTDNDLFNIEKITVDKEVQIETVDAFKVVFILNGNFTIDGSSFSENDVFLMPINQKIDFIGTGAIIITTNKNN